VVSDRLKTIVTERGAVVMAVLNVTPDSFYDGGSYADGRAMDRVAELIEEGADIIDIGGESTRPGACSVAAAEQIRRIEPAVRSAVRDGRVLVSVDTASPKVAARMLDLGAHIVNDVSCLADLELARVAARHRAALVLMHSRGSMDQMEGFSLYPEAGYDDVVADVRREWCTARDRAVGAGMSSGDIWFDPGFGFNKSARHSLELLRRFDEFHSLSAWKVTGPSRKSFIGSVDGSPPEGRLGGTIAACLLGVQRGANVVRVHDVRPVRQALALARAVTPQESVTDA
jgi:dihydropteroate synthase